MHMAQQMPLPLTASCFRKIQTGFTFLVPAHPGIVPEKWPLNGCVYPRLVHSCYVKLYGELVATRCQYVSLCRFVWLTVGSVAKYSE